MKKLYERTKVPVAEYIRQGIDLVLEKYDAAFDGQVDLFTRKLSNSDLDVPRCPCGKVSLSFEFPWCSERCKRIAEERKALR